MTAMDVVVEAGTFCWFPNGGVTRMYREILPRICDATPNLTLEVLAESPLRRPLPAHSSIRRRTPFAVDSLLRPHRLWPPRLTHQARRVAYCVAAGRGRNRIWHSTYYTLPLRWHGPEVVTVYDLIHERFSDLFRGSGFDQMRRRKAHAVCTADRVICISESTRADVVERYGLDPAAVVAIPLASSEVFRVLRGSDDAVADGRPRPAQPEPFLLWVGRRSAYKDFTRFVRAFATWDGRAEVGIVTVGPPLTPTEAGLLANLGIESRVQALTGVDDEALCLLYNRAAAFVYPSLYEGFGIPLLEALACGCPVVAARIPTSIEVAGDCAVLFEPGNAEDMLNALGTALSGGRACDRVRRGCERAAGFSWDKTAVETVRVYKEITAQA